MIGGYNGGGGGALMQLVVRGAADFHLTDNAATTYGSYNRKSFSYSNYAPTKEETEEEFFETEDTEQYARKLLPRGTVCCISLEDIPENAHYVACQTCNQVFGQNELMLWLNQSHSCPMCRHEMHAENINDWVAINTI